MSVGGYLVTAGDDPRMRLWLTSCHVTNWLDLRDQTAHVMVFDEHLEQFLANARQFGVTVQIIQGAGDDETYELLAGEEGSGWTDRKALRWADKQAAQASEEHDEFVNEILERAPEQWDDDAAAEAIAVDYVRHLEAEVGRLGGKLHPGNTP